MIVFFNSKLIMYYRGYVTAVSITAGTKLRTLIKTYRKRNRSRKQVFPINKCQYANKVIKNWFSHLIVLPYTRSIIITVAI